MNKIKYILILAISLGAISCSKDFLDNENLYGKLDNTYYSNATDVEEALAGTYSVLPVGPGANQPTLLGIMLSPYACGGGGVEDYIAHSCDYFENQGEDVYLNLWQEYYRGIFRANMIIKRFDQAEYEDANLKNQHLGEAHFLRAYFYFKLSQFFGEVPLTVDPAPLDLPKSSADQIFAQIASDLKIACDIMPSTPYSTANTGRLGAATKWAAEALMGRVFLFYTGTYGTTELPLVEGGSVSKADALAYLEDCISNSKHALLPDYQSLWPYSSEYCAVTYEDGSPAYPYVYDNGYVWAGEEGGNVETVFAIKYCASGEWTNNATLSRSNQLNLYMGIRDSRVTPFGVGWGWGTVHPALWDLFEEGDERKFASIANWHDDESAAVEGDYKETFSYENYNGMHATGLINKKYMPVYAPDPSLNYARSNIWMLDGQTVVDITQHGNMQDEVIIRYADVLLMAAELGSSNAQTYFDDVRERAGLGRGTKSVSLDAIKMERRSEFSGEGLVYFDLMRWNDLADTFADIPSYDIYSVSEEVPYKISFSEDRKFFPIPESQVRLSNGQLTQNPGWE